MNFDEIHLDSTWMPKWFEARAEVFKNVASWRNKEVDEVFFNFSKPEAGWLNISIYSNGKKLHTFPISAAFDPFLDIKMWMEDIANDFRLSSDLYIDVEGRIIVFHHEYVSLAEVGISRMFLHEEREKDSWEKYDANTYTAKSLFWVYDSETEDMPIVCYCETKQLLFALYVGILEFASRSEATSSIQGGWYYLDDSDNWTLYNTIKSPLIEWLLYSDHAYRHLRPKFNPHPLINETVHMWAEWGDGLFWHQKGGCCGNAEKFFIDTDDTEIDLSSMPEIKEWYDKYENTYYPESPWPKSEYQEWIAQGWELAKKIRLMLPDSVDLFYQWRRFENIPTKYGTGRDMVIIVPNKRTIICDSSKFKLSLSTSDRII